MVRQTGNPILVLMLDFVETLLKDFKQIRMAVADGDPALASN
jgi:hypothetical protein